jgi:hypothetical protein
VLTLIRKVDECKPVQRGHAYVLRWLQDNGCPGAASLEVSLEPDSDTDSEAADSEAAESEAVDSDS